LVKVLILGSTGMLGNAVGKHFLNNSEYETHLSYRNFDVTYGMNKVYFDARKTPLTHLPKVDYIINCIGIIKPNIENDRATSIKINSLFPYKLSAYCKKTKTKLVHITTDCVFSGKAGIMMKIVCTIVPIFTVSRNLWENQRIVWSSELVLLARKFIIIPV